MIISSLKAIFNRDLKRLADEINTYKSEHVLWVTEKGISNSAGNLCLHLIGNLKTYIGLVLGKVDYERNRELEFSLKDIPRFELLRQLDETIKTVNTSLDGLDDEDLLDDYPLIVFEDKMSTGYFLIHLTTHLSYHLGQINYHRRMLDI
ncbi:DUF1572 family protein [Pedobacter sp.]|uniref:DUF1572 family protein n=1 Tax=Pedobacter sp. TaxID=1411316 RepID=UPI003BAB71CA